MHFWSREWQGASQPGPHQGMRVHPSEGPATRGPWLLPSSCHAATGETQQCIAAPAGDQWFLTCIFHYTALPSIPLHCIHCHCFFRAVTAQDSSVPYVPKTLSNNSNAYSTVSGAVFTLLFSERRGTRGSNLIFVQGMQEEYFSKVQSQNKHWVQRPNPGFFTSKCTKLYQREVHNRGAVLGTSSGQSHCRWSWDLAWTCQGNLCKRDFVCVRARTCVHVCEGDARGGGRSASRSIIDSSNSLLCQLLCRRPYDRMWIAGIWNERGTYAK